MFCNLVRTASNRAISTAMPPIISIRTNTISPKMISAPLSSRPKAPILRAARLGCAQTVPVACRLGCTGRINIAGSLIICSSATTDLLVAIVAVLCGLRLKCGEDWAAKPACEPIPEQPRPPPLTVSNARLNPPENLNHLPGFCRCSATRLRAARHISAMVIRGGRPIQHAISLRFRFSVPQVTRGTNRRVLAEGGV